MATASAVPPVASAYRIDIRTTSFIDRGIEGKLRGTLQLPQARLAFPGAPACVDDHRGAAAHPKRDGVRLVDHEARGIALGKKNKMEGGAPPRKHALPAGRQRRGRIQKINRLGHPLNDSL